jgi:CelD/BcsL family acetyltransferase involved in cellulose biosynthesis
MTNQPGYPQLYQAALAQLAERFPGVAGSFPFARFSQLLAQTPVHLSYRHTSRKLAAFRHGIVSGFSLEALDLYHRCALLYLISHRFPENRATCYTEQVRGQFSAEHARIARETAENPTGFYTPENDLFCKDLAVCSGKMFPVGAFKVEISGIPRFNLITGGGRQFLRLARLALKLGHLRPTYELHLDVRFRAEFTPQGWDDCFVQIAGMLEQNPEILGMTGDSWFFDPAIAAVSPRLAYLRQRIEDNGGEFFFSSRSRHTTELALDSSEKRRKLFEQGLYIPASYITFWDRAKLMLWASGQGGDPDAAGGAGLRTKEANPLRTDLIDTVAGFLSLENEWNRLLADSTEDNPFLSHQWLYCWWECYGRGTLHLYTFRDAETGRLAGVLPLFRFRTGGVLPVSILRFLGSERVSSDFLDCLAGKDSDQVYRACLAALQRDSHLWDCLELRDMDAGSPFVEFLRRASLKGVRVVRDAGAPCPFLPLPGSWDSLLLRLSKKTRQRIGYYRRALDRQGQVTMELVSNPAELVQALDDKVRLRLDRLDQKRIVPLIAVVDFHRFHSQLMPRFLECGRLKLYFLRMNGERVAYLYLFAGERSIYFYQTGFARAWGNQSVGFVLLSMVIEQSISDGYSSFEFLRGVEPYKYVWPVSERELITLIVPGRSLLAKYWRLRGEFIHAGRQAYRATKSFIARRKRVVT